MQTENNDPVNSTHVVEMITVANEFCLFIEKVDNYSKEDVIEYLRKMCPLLYIKGCLLPVVGISDESANERFVTEEQWQVTFNDLRNVFQEDDIYWYLDHTDKSYSDPIKASLSENFTDIYQDLKDFIMLYQKNTIAARENAVYGCMALFENHWGYRVVNALKVLHHLVFKENVIDEFDESLY